MVGTMTSTAQRLLLTIATVSIIATGCTANPGTPEPESTPTQAPASAPSGQPTPPSEPTGDGADDFCDHTDTLLGQVPREYVGSDEHVAMLNGLGDIAPERYQDDLYRLADFFDTQVSPSNPDSQNFVNFPADIQELALGLDQGIREECQ